MGEVHPLPPAPERTEAQNELIAAVTDAISDRSEESELVGYALIALYSDSADKTYIYKPQTMELTEGMPRFLGRSLFHAWLHKALDAALAWAEGCDAVNVANGQYDGDPAS